MFKRIIKVIIFKVNHLIIRKNINEYVKNIVKLIT